MILCNLHSQVNPFVTSVFFLIKSKKKNMKKLMSKINLFCTSKAVDLGIPQGKITNLTNLIPERVKLLKSVILNIENSLFLSHLHIRLALL